MHKTNLQGRQEIFKEFLFLFQLFRIRYSEYGLDLARLHHPYIINISVFLSQTWNNFSKISRIINDLLVYFRRMEK